MTSLYQEYDRFAGLSEEDMQFIELYDCNHKLAKGNNTD